MGLRVAPSCGSRDGTSRQPQCAIRLFEMGHGTSGDSNALAVGPGSCWCHWRKGGSSCPTGALTVGSGPSPCGACSIFTVGSASAPRRRWRLALAVGSAGACQRSYRACAIAVGSEGARPCGGRATDRRFALAVGSAGAKWRRYCRGPVAVGPRAARSGASTIACTGIPQPGAQPRRGRSARWELLAAPGQRDSRHRQKLQRREGFWLHP